MQAPAQSRAKALLSDGASTHWSRWNVSHGLLLAQGPELSFPWQWSCCPRSEGCQGAVPPPAPLLPQPQQCLRRCLYSLQLMKIFIILLAAAAAGEARICIPTADPAAHTELPRAALIGQRRAVPRPGAAPPALPAATLPGPRGTAGSSARAVQVQHGGEEEDWGGMGRKAEGTGAWSAC